MATPAQTPQDPQAARTAAAAAVVPDPVTADLLAKHSAKEKLTPEQYGKIGAFAAKAKGFFHRAPAGPAQPGSVQPTVAPMQAQGDVLAVNDADARIVRHTTESILKRLDLISTTVVGGKFEAAGADAKTLDRARRASAFAQGDRELIVDLSPDIAAELQINPRKFPVWTAVGLIAAHGLNLWLVLEELKRLQAAKQAAEPVTDRGSQTPGTTLVGALSHDPATTPPRPAGAPPICTPGVPMKVECAKK